jgi:hypothetical protein
MWIPYFNERAFKRLFNFSGSIWVANHIFKNLKIRLATCGYKFFNAFLAVESNSTY